MLRIMTADRFGLFVLINIGTLAVTGTHAPCQYIKVPEKATPIMTVEDVRIGMKGYGMTVFHGTEIEPFNVEVISIVPNKRPHFSVIWIRSKDDRMVESGPVKGMSGSPIYLWEEGEEQVPGKGGKLIGAFAFGYSETVQCLVGVQPIEYMREAITRVPEAKSADAGGSRGDGIRLLQTLNQIDMLTPQTPASALAKWRIGRLRSWLHQELNVTGEQALGMAEREFVAGPVPGSEAERMMLPIAMGSSEAAAYFAPLYEPMGMVPVATPSGAIGGEPPHTVDPETTMLEPGSALAVPLAFGDLDLGATGTVTDILPTGEVLALGHPMYGDGDLNLPMATGYVHFVVPRSSISFKNAGSLIPTGTLVRDEEAGAVGIAEKRYRTSEIDVSVSMPGQETRYYNYETINHPMAGPRSVANVIFLSAKALHSPPMESSFRLKADMTFTGGRRFTLDTLVPGGGALNVVPEVMPVFATMVDNPFENLEFERGSFDIKFFRGITASSIVNAQLQRSEVAPGETVVIDVELKRYGGETEQKRVKLAIPDELPEGEYPLTVSGVVTYAQLVERNAPQRMLATNLDELSEALQEMLDYKAEALYVTLQQPDAGLAVGRMEMQHLPSSRLSVLQSPTRPQAVPYTPMLEAIHPTAGVRIDGKAEFELRVRQP